MEQKWRCRSKWSNHTSEGEPGSHSLLVPSFAVVIISCVYLILLLSPLHSYLALGRWFPNSNLGINSTSGSRLFYLKFFLYLKIQTPSYPGVLVHRILNSQNFPGFLSPPYYPTEWPRGSQLLESPLDRCSTLGQILPVSPFCLKSALPWSSKLCPSPIF